MNFLKKCLGFFKKASLEIKLFLGGIIGFFGMLLFFSISKKIRTKDFLKNELNKIESEKELIRLEGESNLKKQKLEHLTEKEFEIREKIVLLEKIETEQNREISIEELDAFFDERGF